MFGRVTLALLASASLLPVAAYAQDDTNTSATEEIVVTASKREELLREVPQSVTALTAQTLERTQVNGLTDYAPLVPGLVTTSTQPGQTELSLRGVNAGSLGASVGTYVDETPFGLSTAAGYGNFMAPDLDPFDIARIEVLRGPQGTLYGANTMGGLIKLITVDPDPRAFAGHVRVSGAATDGGDASYAARLSLNIPVGSQAALMLGGYSRHDGGYIDDPTRGAENINSADTTGWRAKFLLNATPDLTIRLSAMGQDIDSDGSSAVDYVTGFPVSPVHLAPLNGPLEQQHPYAEPLRTAYRIFNGTIDWDLGWATLTSASSYGRFDRRAITDYTGILGGPSGPILAPFGESSAYIDEHFTSDKFTQEVRLASPSSDQLEWMVGYFYTKESTEQQQAIRFGPPNGPLAIDILRGVTPGGGAGSVPFGPCGGCLGAATVVLTPHYEENAVFANATYHFTPQFDVSLGARYSSNDQRATQLGTGGLDSGANSSSDSATTYSFSPRWRPNDNLMLYARIATGFRPGGPNTVFAGVIPSTFDPDTLTSYEAGLKADLVPNVLRFDVSAFRVDWKDIQLLFLDSSGVGGTSNGGTARSQGVEWTATLTPLHGLTAVWTGAYTDAELTEAAPALYAADGAALPYVPKWATTLNVDYQWAAFGDATAYVGATARYIGERSSAYGALNFLLLGDPQVDLPSNTQVDLRAGVDFDRYGIEVFARNIGNEDAPLTFSGFTQTAPNALNGAATVPRPQTIGVELTARF